MKIFLGIVHKEKDREHRKYLRMTGIRSGCFLSCLMEAVSPSV
jgi:hypothetical protein